MKEEVGQDPAIGKEVDPLVAEVESLASSREDMGQDMGQVPPEEVA